MNTTRRSLLKGLGATGGIGLAGCTGDDGQGSDRSDGNGGGTTEPSETTATASEPAQLSVAHIQGTTQAPISVGQWQNLFIDNGVAIEPRPFVKPGDMYRNVQNGNLDFMYGLSPLVAARAYHNGQDIRLIRQDVRTFQKLIGPSDIGDPQDLEGKVVSGYASSSSTNFAYRVAFDNIYGVDYDEFYEAKSLAPPVAVSQLKQGRIDAVWTHPPWTSKLLASDDYGVVARAADLYEEATNHELHTADGAAQQSLLTDQGEVITSFYDTISQAAETIEQSPQESLTKSGYTQLFEFENDAQLNQFVQEVSGLYVKEYDQEAYLEDVTFMFEEAASRGYIDSVPDEEIFDLI